MPDIPVRPTNAPISGSTPTLVGRTPPQDVTTPRFDLAGAVADPAFLPRNPSEIQVPPELMTAIAKANKILIVGHIMPDGDDVGSVLTLARAFQMLAKTRQLKRSMFALTMTSLAACD